MKALILAPMLLSVACATAEQRMTDKQNYRNSQLQAISLQTNNRASEAQALSEERVAMWNALAEAVKANPDSATHMAIVAAVASTGTKGEASAPKTVTLNPERDVTALDWAKAFAPALVGGLTQVGIAALTTDYQKEAAKYRKEIAVVEAEVNGKVYDVLEKAFDSAGNSNNDIVIIDADGYSDEAADATVDDLFGADPDTSVTDPVEDTSEDLTDPSETTEPEVVDCSAVTFSPRPPECLEP